MKEFESGAKKDTSNKLPLHLVPPEIEEIFARVAQVGLNKGYAARNWEKGLPIWEGHLAAADRHKKAYLKGEDYNVEQDANGKVIGNEHHLFHYAWHAMAAAVQIVRDRKDLDDRIVSKTFLKETIKESVDTCSDSFQAEAEVDEFFRSK